MFEDLNTVLDDLGAWAEGKSAQDFVFPLVLESTDDLASFRAMLADGIEPLRARGEALTSEDIEGGDLSTPEIVALSLALLLLGYRFVRDHRAKPRQIPRDAFRGGRHWYKLLRSIGARVAEVTDDGEFQGLARAVTECRRAMKPLIAERLRAAKEREDAKRMGDALASVETAANLPPRERTETDEGTLDPLFEDTMDTDLLREVESETQELPPRRGYRNPSVEATPIQAVAAQESSRSRATTGVAILLLLLLIGAVTVLPPLLRKAPKAAVYDEYVPVTGVVRKSGDPGSIIVLVDDRWDALSRSEREEGLRELFERAHDLEDVSRITVQDARGVEAAKIIDGRITFPTAE